MVRLPAPRRQAHHALHQGQHLQGPLPSAPCAVHGGPDDHGYRGEQVIFLINRRGFSSYTQCMECGEVAVCPRCEIPLIYHKQDNSHKCHWCNYEIKNMDKCEKCGSILFIRNGRGKKKYCPECEEKTKEKK